MTTKSEKDERRVVVLGLFDGDPSLLPDDVEGGTPLPIAWDPKDFGLQPDTIPDPYWVVHQLANSHEEPDPTAKFHAEFSSARLLAHDIVGRALETVQVKLDEFDEYGEPAPPCRLHLIGPTNHSISHPTTLLFADLIHVANMLAIPVVLHPVFDDREGCETNPAAIALRLAELLDGEDSRIGTVVGARHIFDPDVDWGHMKELLFAIVKGETEVAGALSSLYFAWRGTGKRLAEMPPMRILGYEGVKGDVAGIVDRDSPEDNGWAWRGEEVALFLDPRPQRGAKLISMLQRQGLPEEVARDTRYLDRFEVIGFDRHALTSLLPQSPGAPSWTPHESSPTRLGAKFESAQTRVLYRAHVERARALFSALRGRDLTTSEREEAFSKADDNGDATESLDAFIETTVSAIESGDHDLVVLNLGNESFENAVDRESESNEAPRARCKQALEAIAASVTKAGGTFVFAPVTLLGEDLRVFIASGGEVDADGPIQIGDLASTVLGSIGLHVDESTTYKSRIR